MWLESFFQNYGAGKLSSLDIPKVYFGEWGKGKYTQSLQLTLEQIEVRKANNAY
jgi:hypothetical protein